MKNFLFFLVMMSFAFALTANAQEFGVKFTLDPDGILNGLGVGPGTDLMIENNSPFYVKLFSSEEFINFLLPSQMAIARGITTGFDQTPISLIGKIYSDKEYSDLVGVAATTIWISGNPTFSGDCLKKWVIDFGSITFIDNRYSYYQYGYANSAYPFPKNVNPIFIKKLPTLPLRSITEWLFINATLYDAIIVLNGVPVIRLAPGQIYTDWKSNDRDFGLQVQVLVRFCQNNLEIGRWDGGSFEIAPGGNLNSHPYSVLYILGPDKNQRPY